MGYISQKGIQEGIITIDTQLPSSSICDCRPVHCLVLTYLEFGILLWQPLVIVMLISWVTFNKSYH